MRPNGKTMILLVGTSVLVSVGAAVGTGLLLRSRTAAPAAHVEAKKETEKKAPETIHPVGDLVVNLTDSPDLRYVKISVAVGIQEKVEDAEIKKFDPLLRDAIISTISHRSFAEMRRAHALEKLKKDLMEAVKGRIPKMEITEIFIEGFAMQ